MKALTRLLLLAAGLAVAALPAARAADEAPPAPPPAAPNADQPAARPERRGRMDPAEMLERLKTAVNLTDDQTAKVKAIFQDQRAKMEALRGDESLSREDRRAKMMELMKAGHDQIRALLTPDQQQKFDAMPRPGFGRGPRGEGPGGEPPPSPPANNPPPPPPPGGGA